MGKEFNFDEEDFENDIVQAEDDLDDKVSDVDEDAILEEATLGLPDPGQALVDMFKFDKRVAWNFLVPEVLKKKAIERAKVLMKENKKLNFKKPDGSINQVKFLYYALRQAGVDIPEDKLLDARRVRK